ncbi:MAG: HTTM domain-containing protein, partial [Bacteroidota bacterium]
EGHRLSWRMMLRTKSGSLKVYVEDLETKERERINLREYLSRDQRSSVTAQPDMLWQFAQRLEKEYALKGKQVAVYADALVSLNGHPRKALIDKSVNLADVKWERFKHADWILTNEDND